MWNLWYTHIYLYNKYTAYILVREYEVAKGIPKAKRAFYFQITSYILLQNESMQPAVQ